MSRSKILVIHGPNFKILSHRSTQYYGGQSLENIITDLQTYGQNKGFEVESFQSNHEGALIDYLNQALVDWLNGSSLAGLIVNLGAYTHTSLALRDALEPFFTRQLVIVEVHLGHIFARTDPPLRQISLIAPVTTGTISGLGVRGYRLALDFFCEPLN